MADASIHLGIWVAAAWGLGGGLCVEAFWLYTQIRSAKGMWSCRRPIPQGLSAYLVSVVLRVGLGAGVAAAAAGSGQVSGTLAAFGLGVAAPLVLEKLSQAVPLTGALSSATPTRQPNLADPLTAGRTTPANEPANHTPQAKAIGEEVNGAG